jgi:hypothetical protein
VGIPAIGSTVVFHYSLQEDDNSEISHRLAHRSGQNARVTAAPIDPDGNLVAFPTRAERSEAGALVMVPIQFEDGHNDEAYEDEIEEA